MTRDKSQKRATRARMAKTGERYTAARRHAVKPEEEFRAEDMPQTETALRKNTGKGWKEWLRILDAWGAKERKHGDVVRFLMEERGVSGWWAQTVTIGFERARGLRARYQRATGFTVSVSKTFPVPLGRMFKAFAEGPQRNKWLEKGALRVRTSRKNKDIRFDHEDGATRLIAYFESKGPAKTTVVVEHERLPDADAVEEMRAIWKDRLRDLARVIR